MIVASFLGDFLASPAAGALLVAALNEVNARRRARQADAERRAFRRELAGLDSPAGYHEET